jgi:hypothetical protein
MSEDVLVFVVHWTRPNTDAVVPVLCENCGAERWTSAENLQAAKSRGMTVACVECTLFSLLQEEPESIVSGSVRHGKVIERE